MLECIFWLIENLEFCGFSLILSADAALSKGEEMDKTNKMPLLKKNRWHSGYVLAAYEAGGSFVIETRQSFMTFFYHLDNRTTRLLTLAHL